MSLLEYLAFLILCVCICAWIRSSKPEENKEAKKVVSKLLIYLEAIYFMIFAKDNKGIGHLKYPDLNPDPEKIKGCESNK
jgi:hypothetical protein